MTLQEAVEEIKHEYNHYGLYEYYMFHDYFLDSTSEAIATILNAVVKGELKIECK